jgi:hypothetical protein
LYPPWWSFMKFDHYNIPKSVCWSFADKSRKKFKIKMFLLKAMLSSLSGFSITLRTIYFLNLSKAFWICPLFVQDCIIGPHIKNGGILILKIIWLQWSVEASRFYLSLTCLLKSMLTFCLIEAVSLCWNA